MSESQLRTPADIGALIRDRRRILKLDQADLAGVIGVSRLWVNQVERGKPGSSLGLILRALDAVGVKLIARTSDHIASKSTDATPVITADIDAIVADARRANRS